MTFKAPKIVRGRPVSSGFYWLLINDGWTIVELEVDDDRGEIRVNEIGSEGPRPLTDYAGLQIIGPIPIPETRIFIPGLDEPGGKPTA